MKRFKDLKINDRIYLGRFWSQNYFTTPTFVIDTFAITSIRKFSNYTLFSLTAVEATERVEIGFLCSIFLPDDNIDLVYYNHFFTSNDTNLMEKVKIEEFSHNVKTENIQYRLRRQWYEHICNFKNRG